VRDQTGRVVTSGEVMMLAPCQEPPAAIRTHEGLAVTTGIPVGSGSGPIRYIYVLVPPSAFSAHVMGACA
jgi:hypothetical protein